MGSWVAERGVPCPAPLDWADARVVDRCRRSPGRSRHRRGGPHRRHRRPASGRRGRLRRGTRRGTRHPRVRAPGTGAIRRARRRRHARRRLRLRARRLRRCDALVRGAGPRGADARRPGADRRRCRHLRPDRRRRGGPARRRRGLRGLRERTTRTGPHGKGRCGYRSDRRPVPRRGPPRRHRDRLDPGRRPHRRRVDRRQRLRRPPPGREAAGRGPLAEGRWPEDFGATTNTTIGVLATNARLDKTGCLLLAQGGHGGIARAIEPSHTLVDGDALVALSCGDLAAPPDQVRALGARAVHDAILAVLDREAP